MAIKTKLSIYMMAGFMLLLLPKAVGAVKVYDTDTVACSGGYAMIDGAYYKDTNRAQVEMGNGVHYFKRTSSRDSGNYQAYVYDAKNTVSGYNLIYILLLNKSDKSSGYLDVWSINNKSGDITIICSSSIALSVSAKDPNSSKTTGDISTDANKSATTSSGSSSSTSSTSSSESSEPLTISFLKENVPLLQVTSSCTGAGDTYEGGLLDGLSCNEPIKSITDVEKAILNIMDHLLIPISGLLFTLMMIVGGIIYMASGANPKRIELGKKVLTYAIIGLLVSLLAYTIVSVFANLIGGGVST